MLGAGAFRGDRALGFHRNGPVLPRVPALPRPLGSAVLLQAGGAGALGGPGWGLGRRHVTALRGHSLAQQLIMDSPGPFAITAAIPWIDRVDFLPLPLPQPCQLAFVSEGNRVENVTLQTEKLQALPL